MTQYAIHTALQGDSNEGWVWIRPEQSHSALTDALKAGGRRPIVQIVGPSAKKVFFEALAVDTFYKRRWAEVARRRQGDNLNEAPIDDAEPRIFLSQEPLIFLS
jgi:hypothetical protein